MDAIQRHTARQTIVQMQALRVAAWGSDDDVSHFRSALTGDASTHPDDTAAALEAFGLRWAE